MISRKPSANNQDNNNRTRGSGANSIFRKTMLQSTDCLNPNEVGLFGMCYDIETTTEINLSEYTNPGILTGEIPDRVCELTNLSYLRLAAGELEGEVPECIWYMPNLTYINLRDNNLTGSFYNIQWQNSSAFLKKIFLQNNLFGGSFSETLCSIYPNLDIFEVSYNHLCQEPLSCFEENCFNDDGWLINEGCWPVHWNQAGVCLDSTWWWLNYCVDAIEPTHCYICNGMEEPGCKWIDNYCVGYQECD